MATPKLTLRAGTKPVEGGANGSFVIDLSAAATSDLTVNFNPTGTATLGTDYSFSLTVGSTTTAITGNSFVLPTGTTTATLNVIAKTDSVTDPNETVGVSLATGTGYDLASTTVMFAPHVDYAIEGSPGNPVVADFNNDGNLDVITTSTYNSKLLLGDGQGNFAVPLTKYTGGIGGYEIATDLNNDGSMDLVTGSYYGGSVTSYLGDGKGNFVKPSTVSGFTLNSMQSMIAGDFNRDGKADVVTVNSADNSVSVLLGKGDGSFMPKMDIATGRTPNSVVAADINGDGNTDLISVNKDSYDISVLLNNGDGSFQPKRDVSVGSVPFSVTAGDFNGDGKIDVATSNIGTNSVSILLGKGDGSFLPKTDIAVQQRYPNAITSGDYNGDGNLDLVTANNFGYNVSLLSGDGKGGFSETAFATGVQPMFVVNADVNNDGKQDLITTNYYSSNNISVLLNTTQSSRGTLTITDVVPVNNSIISLSNTPTNFIEAKDVPSTAIIVDNAITVTTSTAIATATVGITGGSYVNSEDVLLFRNDETGAMGNIVAYFDSNTGVLSLQSAGSTATQAQWNAALQAVKYVNTSDTPHTNDRNLSFVVNDGTNSNPATKTVTVTATNDTPTFAIGDGVAVTNVGYHSQGNSITVQDDGKILVAGASTLNL